MGLEVSLIPLFPLEVVLFPGGSLPLHIFEPRYRSMISRAIEQESEFGIILVSGGKLADVGCTAIVERVTKRYDDGRFDVETKGLRRFRTLSIDDSQACVEAQVEYFDDLPGPSAPRHMIERTERLAREVASLVRVSPELHVDAEMAPPSFQIAHELPLELPFKQRLLCSLSETDRLTELAEYLEKLLHRISEVRRVRRVAGTNGKAQ
jgi:Lon protease-like protein